MKPELKELVEELQMAFNESVCESDHIAEVLAEIKRSGYEVVLALDVTIGVTAAKQEQAAEAPVTTNAPVIDAVSGQISLSDEDRLFLRDMHVAVE